MRRQNSNRRMVPMTLVDSYLKSYARSLGLSYRKGTFCPRVTAKDKREISQAEIDNEAAAQKAASGKARNHFDELCAEWERRF